MFESCRSNARGICAVIGGILIQLTFGNLYSFGNMTTYMTSYMNERVDASVNYGNFVWVYALIIFSQGFFMIVGGWMENWIGPRLTCLCGGATMSFGIMLTYYTMQYSFGGVVFTYGFLAGLGIALGYATPLACGMKWFPTRKGLVNGLIIGGFGLGSLGSTTFQTLYVNPQNVAVNSTTKYFDDPSVLDAVPSLFVVMGFIFLVLQVTGCVLLSKPSSNMQSEFRDQIDNLLDDEDETTELNPIQSGGHYRGSIYADFKPRDLLRLREFYILTSIFLINTVGIGFISAMYKSFGQTFISNDMFLAQIGSFAAVFNCVGRLVWGRLMDATTFKFSMTLLASLFSVLMLSIPLTRHMPTGFYPIWVWAIFFVFSGTFSLMPTVTEKAFGQKHYSANYGLVFTNQAVSGPLLAILSSSIINYFGYSTCFICVGVLLLGTPLLALLLPQGL